MQLEIFTTGGTIDKVYFDAKSSFEVGEPQIESVLHEANLVIDYRVTSLLRKDSLELTDEDRALIRKAVLDSAADRIVITHGTDTMINTAIALEAIPGKTIVLTGALSPARFRSTDAVFNVGLAIGALQSLGEGVFLERRAPLGPSHAWPPSRAHTRR